MDDVVESHDLMASVAKLTYRGIRADAAQAGPPPAAAPQRFRTRFGMETTRRHILTLCFEYGAEDGLQDFLSTRWLERFAPATI